MPFNKAGFYKRLTAGFFFFFFYEHFVFSAKMEHPLLRLQIKALFISAQDLRGKVGKEIRA